MKPGARRFNSCRGHERGSPRRRGVGEFGVPAGLIIQRSQVQILSPLLGAAAPDPGCSWLGRTNPVLPGRVEPWPGPNVPRLPLDCGMVGLMGREHVWLCNGLLIRGTGFKSLATCEAGNRQWRVRFPRTLGGFLRRKGRRPAGLFNSGPCFTCAASSTVEHSALNGGVGGSTPSRRTEGGEDETSVVAG